MEETDRSDGFNKDDAEEFNEAWRHGGVITGVLEGTHRCPSNQSRVDIHSQISIDGQLLSSIDSEVSTAKCAMPDLVPSRLMAQVPH
ncbi:hypothetical protein DY000_02030987 [Brassica cretica]|uniref:Uncharacterized protein n=1 Tax=Brassica cretica TaxID=69181 RepID=A0ABQ7DNF1_BRACR|nr:hypothetical protein DY000_02030987 [Brassica cretica]